MTTTLRNKCMTVADLIERLSEYEGDKSEPVICKGEDGYEYVITDIEINGHQFDLDDEDSLENCCFLYGYLDP